ncbi:hypothetical protein BJ912DRAFT_117217, partial [Pholiota molesta]
KLIFLHASLPDFLVDKSRSEQYHINLDEYRTKLLCRFLERHPPMLDPLWSGNDLRAAMDRESSRLVAIRILLEHAKASKRLHRAFMNFNCTFYRKTILDSTGLHDSGPTIILQPLKRLDFRDQGEAYRHVVNIFATEYAKYWPALTVDGKQSVEKRFPDVVARIKQIQEHVN